MNNEEKFLALAIEALLLYIQTTRCNKTYNAEKATKITDYIYELGSGLPEETLHTLMGLSADLYMLSDEEKPGTKGGGKKLEKLRESTAIMPKSSLAIERAKLYEELGYVVSATEFHRYADKRYNDFVDQSIKLMVEECFNGRNKNK